MMFLIRITAFIAVLYFIYFSYKLLQKPTSKKVSKKTASVTCPSLATLADYTKGKIKGNQRQELYKHIANCKDCQSALQSMFDTPAEGELKRKKPSK